MIADPAAALAALDRRGFLRWVGGAAALGLLPSGCGAPAAWAPPPGRALRFLTPRSYAALCAAADRFAGARAAALLRRREVDPGAAVERFLASAPQLAPALQRALLALEFGIPPFLAKLAPFSSLDAAPRDAILAELMDSRLALKRQLFAGVKSVALLGLYGSAASQPVERHPGVAGASIEDAMRYEPPPDRGITPGPDRSARRLRSGAGA